MSGQAAKPRTFLGLYHAGRWMGIAVRGGRGQTSKTHIQDDNGLGFAHAV